MTKIDCDGTSETTQRWKEILVLRSNKICEDVPNALLIHTTKLSNVNYLETIAQRGVHPTCGFYIVMVMGCCPLMLAQ